MARKSLQTPDSRHIQFGDVDTFTQPDDSTAPDTGAFTPGWFGQEMENGGGGFGSAYAEVESYPESSEGD